MRKLILSMHMSLDGFVASPNKDMSWMQTDNDEEWEGLFAMVKNMDLFLLGRGMWKEYRDYWTKAFTGPGFSENEVKYAKLAVKKKHLIFSKTLKQTGWENAEVISGDLKKTVTKLKQQPGKDIQVVGGARFAGSLIDSGLIDEYRLLIEPVILAKGISFFSKLVNRHRLEIKDVKKQQNGVVVVRYVQMDTSNTEGVKPGKKKVVSKKT